MEESPGKGQWAHWEGRGCQEEAGLLGATEGHPGGSPESLSSEEGEEEGQGRIRGGMSRSPSWAPRSGCSTSYTPP